MRESNSYAYLFWTIRAVDHIPELVRCYKTEKAGLFALRSLVDQGYKFVPTEKTSARVGQVLNEKNAQVWYVEKRTLYAE